MTCRGTFPRDSSWGHRISITEFKGDWGRCNGHISPPVKEGDTFRYQMESGKIAEFELTKVKNCNDPRDQFFAEFKPLGYVDDR